MERELIIKNLEELENIKLDGVRKLTLYIDTINYLEDTFDNLNNLEILNIYVKYGFIQYFKINNTNIKEISINTHCIIMDLMLNIPNAKKVIFNNLSIFGNLSLSKNIKYFYCNKFTIDNLDIKNYIKLEKLVLINCCIKYLNIRDNNNINNIIIKNINEFKYEFIHLYDLPKLKNLNIENNTAKQLTLKFDNSFYLNTLNIVGLKYIDIPESEYINMKQCMIDTLNSDVKYLIVNGTSINNLITPNLKVLGLFKWLIENYINLPKNVITLNRRKKYILKGKYFRTLKEILNNKVRYFNFKIDTDYNLIMF